MRFLVADDHPLFREAVAIQIRRLYPDAAVDETASFGEAITLAENPEQTYDLLLIDYYMPGVSLAAIEDFAGRFPDVPFAVMSGSANSSDIRAAIKAGARGFVPKTATSEHVASAVQLLLSGGTSVPIDILMSPQAAATASQGEAVPWLSRLTPREFEVLACVAKGLSNKEIGRELDLAEVTIKLHLRSIFRKINARSRAEAAVLATKAGIG